MRESGSSSFYRRITLGFLMFLSLWLLTAVLLPAQTAPNAPTAPASVIDSQQIRPALGVLQTAVQTVNVGKWKAPDQVKSVAQDDLNSIVNDLNSILPGLLQTAQASPSAFQPAFEVYRNVNALYDVVLRVSQVAGLAASASDASYLQNALNELGKARKSLSDSLATASTQRDAELVQLRTKLQAVAASAASQPSSTKKVVVNDGPNGASSKKRSSKSSSSSSPSTPQQ
jgi:hypothetical protein